MAYLFPSASRVKCLKYENLHLEKASFPRLDLLTIYTRRQSLVIVTCITRHAHGQTRHNMTIRSSVLQTSCTHTKQEQTVKERKFNKAPTFFLHLT